MPDMLYGIYILLKVHVDNSVEIIYYGTIFSPYKSDLHRRSKKLPELKWSQVILDDSDDNYEEDVLEDTADSSTNIKTGYTSGVNSEAQQILCSLIFYVSLNVMFFFYVMFLICSFQ
ncbi:hypothetical protein Hanom_Chr00s000001g01597071 [Helianthus anomalus]